METTRGMTLVTLVTLVVLHRGIAKDVAPPDISGGVEAAEDPPQLKRRSAGLACFACFARFPIVC